MPATLTCGIVLEQRGKCNRFAKSRVELSVSPVFSFGPSRFQLPIQSSPVQSSPVQSLLTKCREYRPPSVHHPCRILRPSGNMPFLSFSFSPTHTLLGPVSALPASATPPVRRLVISPFPFLRRSAELGLVSYLHTQTHSHSCPSHPVPLLCTGVGFCSFTLRVLAYPKDCKTQDARRTHHPIIAVSGCIFSSLTFLPFASSSPYLRVELVHHRPSTLKTRHLRNPTLGPKG
jgi:hypothetical protein